MDERRGGLRVPVQMWVEEQGPTGTYFQRSANLSEGGIFLERTIPHPMGTQVTLKLQLPDGGEPVEVRAEIVNAAAGEGDLGMGLRFIDLDDAAARRIRRLVEKHAK
jgi:uncharacterized protein (TIGR02266 family)